jgi:lambda family phage tail tape measure protein
MAENVDVNVNVNTSTGVANLDKLNKSVKSLEASFANLKNMVAGFVLGNLVSSTLQMADAVSDLAKATGISTAAVLGFSQAVKENGGDSEGARKAIEKFALSLEEARNGSREAQDALQAAGLSLKEIGNLDLNTAFSSYVKGLGKIEGETSRLANANQMMGKHMRSVDFEAVAGSLDAYTIKNARAAVETEKVGEMVDNFQKATGELQKVLLTVLTPIADLVNWFAKGGEPAGTFLNIILSIAAVFAGGWILKGIQALIGLGAWLATTTTGLTVLGAAAGAAATSIANFFGIIDLDKLKAMVGLQTDAAKRAEEQAAAEKKLSEEQSKARKEAEAKELQIKKASNAIELASQKQIDATKKSIEQYNTQFDMNTKLMGQTEEQKLAVTTLYDLQQRKIAALLPLQEKLRELQSIPAGARGATDKAEMAATQNAINNVTKQYDAQVPIVQKLLAERIKQMVVERDLAYNAEMVTKAYEAQSAVEEQMNNISVGAIDKVMQMQNEYAQSTLPGVQAELRKIADEQNAIAKAAKRQVAIQFENDPEGLSKAISNIDKATQQAIQIQQTAAESIYNSQRTFSYGWEQAFNKYIDDATNAATMASQAFTSITGNMNSAIDKFVETGKFSFSDFARSVIQDLIKIELKAQATKLLGAIGGGGGIFSAIGSLFGFADGGSPPVNKPSIVGEKGPELFVPRTAGTVIPNGAGMGPQNVTNTYITNQISAIDSKSVAQLFAENRKTLLGTVQLAQKELPYGNR